MNRYEPQMCQTRLQHRIDRFAPVEPVEKTRHLVLKPCGRRRLEMDALPLNRPGHHLHRTVPVITPLPDPYAPQPVPPCREQTGMPAEKPLLRQWLLVFPGRIQHHFHDPLDIPICCRLQATRIYPKAASD